MYVNWQLDFDSTVPLLQNWTVPLYLLGRRPEFPHPREAEPDGLLALGGDLAPRRLLEAYRRGIFPWPWGETEPLAWYSPPERCVFRPGGVVAGRSLRRTLRSGRFECRVDTRFPSVIRLCAATPRPGQRGTWITAAVARAYTRMHRLGHAHSVETWSDGALVGGLYGLAIGGAFFAESMFHLAPDASKFALYHLSEMLRDRRFALIDAQIPTPFLARLGGRTIPRDQYLEELGRAIDLPIRFAHPGATP